jgi:pimeloyl-ACP methyl ester carboxylesterase
MQFINTSCLRVGFEEWNPTAQKTIVLMHGWPDSIRCWSDVAPSLAHAGYRVITPALRGFNPTSFLLNDTPRTGQLAALGRDLIEFVAALNLKQPYSSVTIGAPVLSPTLVAYNPVLQAIL